MQTIIKREMILWSRERAGLSREEIAQKLQVDLDRFIAWEEGRSAIPFSIAKKISKISLIPLGLLFADAVPEEGLPIADFRTPGSYTLEKPSPELIETIHDAKRKQEWYREYLISEDYEPLPFIGIYRPDNDPKRAAGTIIHLLSLDSPEYPRCRDWQESLRYLINHAEDAGITVLITSIFRNNTHRPLISEEFRGFVLSDPIAPLVMINGSDAKPAQVFTLIHEIAHLLIDVSGVLDSPLLTPTTVPQEQWCNQVAAEVLAPAGQVISLWNQDADNNTNLDTLRKKLKVSRLVAIIRAYHLGLITDTEKDRYYADEIGRIIATKKKDQERSGGGPDPHLIRRYKTGRNLALAVLSEVASGQMLYRDAFSILGVKNASGLKEFAERLGYHRELSP
ncbi:MAG: ImmA/IrrE family metallo-endopeptidase [Methanospirillaceae archaeon]|nr:ImmA/IrrE family metallo-endopeptidase [Methanospirillaceae archaeon]